MAPSEMPRVRSVKRKNIAWNSTEEEKVVIEEVWYQNMTSCPEGTVPIRRTTVEDVLRAGSLSEFGKKHPKIALARHDGNPEISRLGHEVRVLPTTIPFLITQFPKFIFVTIYFEVLKISQSKNFDY